MGREPSGTRPGSVEHPGTPRTPGDPWDALGPRLQRECPLSLPRYTAGEGSSQQCCRNRKGQGHVGRDPSPMCSTVPPAPHLNESPSGVWAFPAQRACSCGCMFLCSPQPMAQGEPNAEEPQQQDGQAEGAGLRDEDASNGTFVWGTTVSVQDVTSKFTRFVRTFTENDADVESKYSALLNEVWQTFQNALRCFYSFLLLLQTLV